MKPLLAWLILIAVVFSRPYRAEWDLNGDGENTAGDAHRALVAGIDARTHWRYR